MGGGRSESRSRSRGRGGFGGGDGGDRGNRGKGIVVTWHDEKGFGFIKPDKGGDDLFAHVSNLKDGDALKEGTEVTYEEVYDDRKGKYRAEEVLGCCDRRDVKGKGRGGGGYGGRDSYSGRGGYDDRDRSRDRGRGGGRDRGRYDSRSRGRGDRGRY